jgi:hypothetical protein
VSSNFFENGRWNPNSDDYRALLQANREWEARAAGAIAELECLNSTMPPGMSPFLIPIQNPFDPKPPQPPCPPRR